MISEIDTARRERDDARRWARRFFFELGELIKVSSNIPPIVRRLEAENARLEVENAALRRELEALKRRLPVWFDVGHNETDQESDGFPP